MTWAERALDRIGERCHRRIAMLKWHGPELPAWFLFLEWLASYRDLAYMAVLRPFLREKEEE